MKLIISDVWCVTCDLSHVMCHAAMAKPGLNHPQCTCTPMLTDTFVVITHHTVLILFQPLLQKDFFTFIVRSLHSLLFSLSLPFDHSLFLFLCNVCLVLLTSISIPKPASVFWNAIFLRKLSIIYSSRCQCRSFVRLDPVSASDVKLTNRQLKVWCV